MPTPEEAAAAAAAAAAAGTKPWYEGKLDQELVGHLQMRGLHDKPVEEVALNLTKAHRDAQIKLSTDPAHLLKIPQKPDDVEGWKQVYTKLGAPADAKEYDFAPIKVKQKDGTEGPLDADTEAFLRAQAAKHHLSKQAALEMAQDFIKRDTDNSDKEKAETTATLAEQKQKLATNWKDNFDGNMFVAKQGAAKLGITPEEVAGMEKVIGYDRIMESFRKIGVMAGEHKFVQDPNKPAGGVMTKEEAVAKRAELMSDPVWKAAYLGGDKAKLREFMALGSIVSGTA